MTQQQLGETISTTGQYVNRIIKKKVGLNVERVFAIVLMIAFMCGMTGCDSSMEQEDEPADTGMEQQDEPVDTGKQKEIIYEDETFKAVFLGISHSETINTFYLNVRLENKTDGELTVIPMDSSVNDTMVMFGSGIPGTMRAGKNFNQAWIIGSEAPAIIEFAMSACDENMEEIVCTDIIQIDVSDVEVDEMGW